MEAELIENEETNDKDKRLAKFDPVKAGLSALTEKYSSGPPADLSVPENYEICRLACSEMRKKRTSAEKIRKELKADALEYGRKVDGIAKQIIDHIAALEKPFNTAKKEFDAKIEIEKREKALAEERRVDGIASRIAEIGALPSAHISSNSWEIAAVTISLDALLSDADGWAMEFADKAKATVIEAQQKLKDLHAMKVQQEQIAAEKAKAEKEAAEKAEADRIQREKEAAAERERLAIERAKLAAEQAELERVRKEQQAELDRQRAEQQAEIDRQQAELKRQLAEQQAEIYRQRAITIIEKDKVQEEQRQIEEAPPQPAPPQPASAGQAQNYREAGKAIKEITNDFQMAKAILDSIINGDIPHITYTGAKS